MEKTSGKQKSNNLSFSPLKGNKYKNFLTSILSPSTKKRHSRRKSGNVHRESEFPFESKSAQQSTESIYSTMDDVENAVPHRKSSLASEVSDSISSAETIPDHKSLNRTEPRVMTAVSEDPVYAIVHKPPVKPKRKSFDVASLQDAKEDNKLLRLRMKDISEENCHLKKQLQCLEKQDKMKESTLHAKLQLEITRLEAETRKEVKALSNRIGMLAEEKSLLSGQLDLVHAEKREVQAKYDSLLEESMKKVDADFHSKTIAEYRRLLEQTKQKYNAEVIKYKEECKVLEDTNKALESSLTDLKEKLSSTEKRVKSLAEENKASNEERKQLHTQLEESRQIEEEHQKLLLSLLNVTETLAVERDILLNKSSFQESQQKELQTSVVGYSLNVGRLQEHITHLSHENIQELLKLHSSKTYKEENVHQYYGEQLDILREKILNQNNTITKLEGEKRLLELQLESRWESHCS